VVLDNSGAGSVSGTVFTPPPNSQGTICVNYINPSGNFYRYYFFLRSASTGIQLNLIRDSPNNGKPDVNISGANIRVENGTGGSGSKTVGYWIYSESI